MIYLFAVLIFLAISARWNWWRPKVQGIPILMYHKIGDPPMGSKLKKLWVSPRKFRKQLAYLKKKGYESITFKNLAAMNEFDSRKVIITFDDGYRNNFLVALPILKEFGYEAVFFVVSGAAGGKNFWHNSELEEPVDMLTWEEIKKMDEDGMEIGGHALSHKNLSELPDDALEKEIFEDKKNIEEKLGKNIMSFAYPYGKFNEKVKEILRRAGYLFACKIKQGKNKFPVKDRFELRRILVRGDECLFDFYLNLSRGRVRL
ncbi:MAG: polysaccharide deacetylase family protein [Elusimicrobiota bacterium]